MSSAAEIRARRRQTPKTIAVTLADGLVMQCRRPDLLLLAVSGWVSWPALQRVQALVAERTESTGADALLLDNRPQPTMFDRAHAVGALLDEWVCAAAVTPQVAMTEAESTEDVLWIDDLSLEDRLAVYTATLPKTNPSVSEFRSDQPPSAPPGSGSETVRDAPVDTTGG